MFSHDMTKENAYRFSRMDEDHVLSTFSAHPLVLEEQNWLTAEHYYQVHIAGNQAHADRIYQAPTPLEAHKLGSLWYRRKKSGWKKLRRVLMTRALYTKAMMYSAVKDELLGTGEELILETSLYDHYWGIGRDQRGENMLGKVWMDIRKKIKQDS